MFYKLAPEVAGHLGPGTDLDRSTHPPIVYSLHYEFDGWPEDDLITATPCFLVTDRLKEWLQQAAASGCSFGPATTTTSEQFDELEELERLPQPRTLPRFSWLIVSGTAQQDDFGTSPVGSLIVSERALQVLKRGRLDHCDITAI